MNDIMSHDQAVNTQAPARYLLGVLKTEELEAFESHYFDCTICFDQIRKSAELLGMAREVLSPEPEKGWLASMFGELLRPATVSATALLLCAISVGIYQQGRIADIQKPHVVESVVLTDESRGGRIIRVSHEVQLNLGVELTKQAGFTAYSAQIVTESGKVKYTLRVPMDETRDKATISLLASSLTPGKYSLVIEGLSPNGSATEARRVEFDLQFSD